jgi:DNA-binding response OmpR family regulator
MGGTIGVTSQVGAGTQFSVSLPMKEIPGAPVAPATESARALGATAPDGIAAHATRPDPPAARIPRKTALNNLTHADTRDLPTILLIEDNADMREFIKGGLRDACRILEAENGETGLKMASAKLPDLIITDLMMPKMDGIQLCSELKGNLETSHIPIVMLTARAGLENKIEGLETGADDYLTKPFVARELLVRVRNLLQQRRRLRDYYRKSEYSLHPEKISATSLDQKFLEKVQELLEARHADADFDVSHMQRELAMSKTQLNRKLKALTDESPRDILRNYRLKRAAQLLAQQSDTVTQIAYQVGFNNLSYFAKCFRKQYGVAPSSY